MSVFSTSSVVAKIHAPQTPLPVPAVQFPIANACLELSDRVAAQLATQVPLALFKWSVHSSIICQKCSKTVHQTTPFTFIFHLSLREIAVDTHGADVLTSVLNAM
jgi:hypothetical protein